MWTRGRAHKELGAEGSRQRKKILMGRESLRKRRGSSFPRLPNEGGTCAEKSPAQPREKEKSFREKKTLGARGDIGGDSRGEGEDGVMMEGTGVGWKEVGSEEWTNQRRLMIRRGEGRGVGEQKMAGDAKGK